MLDGSVVLQPFDQAAERYGVTEQELREALENRWILGDPEIGVDGETVKKWLSGREKWARKKEQRKHRTKAQMEGLHIKTDYQQVHYSPTKKISVGKGKLRPYQ